MLWYALLEAFLQSDTINGVRDLTSSLLTEVFHNVAIEPSLQPVTTETFSLASANTTNDAGLDIKTRGFWSRGHAGCILLIFGCFT